MADKQQQDAASTAVQDHIAKEQAQGYRGVEVDQTPNEAYTVAGVLKDMPTPETQRQSPDQVRENWAPVTGKGGEK
jgi:hypothetical protein